MHGCSGQFPSHRCRSILYGTRDGGAPRCERHFAAVLPVGGDMRLPRATAQTRRASAYPPARRRSWARTPSTALLGRLRTCAAFRRARVPTRGTFKSSQRRSISAATTLRGGPGTPSLGATLTPPYRRRTSRTRTMCEQRSAPSASRQYARLRSRTLRRRRGAGDAFADAFTPRPPRSQVPFRAAVTSGRAAGVMCAYTAINGVPSCANAFLLRTILRQQWGFDGYVTGAS